jgi:hypothetical protein
MNESTFNLLIIAGATHIFRSTEISLRSWWGNYGIWGPKIQFWLWEADFEVFNQIFVVYL